MNLKKKKNSIFIAQKQTFVFGLLESKCIYSLEEFCFIWQNSVKQKSSWNIYNFFSLTDWYICFFLFIVLLLIPPIIANKIYLLFWPQWSTQKIFLEAIFLRFFYIMLNILKIYFLLFVVPHCMSKKMFLFFFQMYKQYINLSLWTE